MSSLNFTHLFAYLIIFNSYIFRSFLAKIKCNNVQSSYDVYNNITQKKKKKKPEHLGVKLLMGSRILSSSLLLMKPLLMFM
jgi:hypothetical protein